MHALDITDQQLRFPTASSSRVVTTAMRQLERVQMVAKNRDTQFMGMIAKMVIEYRHKEQWKPDASSLATSSES